MIQREVSSTHYVYMARSRLDHACTRMNDLLNASNQYLSSRPFHIEREFFDNHDVIPCVRFRYRVTALPPPTLGLLVGEIIHQLRATLDNLVWALGQVYPSQNSKAKNEKLAFPLAENIEKFEKLLTKPEYVGIHDFPTEAQSTILDVQSFRRTLYEPDLGILHRLWNADKHKVPSILIMHSHAVSQYLDLRSPSYISVGEISDGAIFLEGALPPQGIAADASPQLTGVVLGVNDPLLPNAKYSFQALMYESTQLVNRVIQKLEPLFPVESR